MKIVHIVDDDDVRTRRLGLFLQDHGHKVVISGTVSKFMSVFDPEQIGCIVLAESMSGPTGSETLSAISRWLPIYPAILIVDSPDLQIAVKAVKIGVFSVIKRPAEPAHLMTCLKDALAWGSEVWDRYAADARVWSDLQTLTSRELEVLGLIIDGQSSKSIGNLLKISARTVDNHRVHIMSKMRAKSLGDLGRAVGRATAIFAEGATNARISKSLKSK